MVPTPGLRFPQQPSESRWHPVQTDAIPLARSKTLDYTSILCSMLPYLVPVAKSAIRCLELCIGIGITACRPSVPFDFGPRSFRPYQRKLPCAAKLSCPTKPDRTIETWSEATIQWYIYLAASSDTSSPLRFSSLLFSTYTGSSSLGFQSSSNLHSITQARLPLKRANSCLCLTSLHTQHLPPLLLKSTHSPCPPPPPLRRAKPFSYSFLNANLSGRLMAILVPSLHSCHLL